VTPLLSVSDPPLLRQVRDARIDMPIVALTASVQDELQGCLDAVETIV